MDATIDVRPSATPRRIAEPDGAALDVFSLPLDTASLEELFRDLFEHHWREIVFGPIIQGAAWEIHADRPPTRIRLLDGYLTVAFGVTHFHVCIGENKGSRARPTSPELAKLRRTSRAELYRRRNTSVCRCRGDCAVQRRRRTADHRAAAQSLPRRGNRQGSQGAGLVASRAVGQIARALVRPARPRSRRSFSRPVTRRLRRRAFEFNFRSVHLKGETSCR